MLPCSSPVSAPTATWPFITIIGVDIVDEMTLDTEGDPESDVDTTGICDGDDTAILLTIAILELTAG